MNAPCPSEICPFIPVRMMSPRIAIAYAATKIRSKTRNDGTIHGSTAIATAATAGPTNVTPHGH